MRKGYLHIHTYYLHNILEFKFVIKLMVLEHLVNSDTNFQGQMYKCKCNIVIGISVLNISDTFQSIWNFVRFLLKQQ
jgi:hypothetical protein